MSTPSRKRVKVGDDGESMSTSSKNKELINGTPISSSGGDGTSEDSPVQVHHIDYTTVTPQQSQVPSIPLDPNLDTLLYPLKGHDFLKNSLRQRAVHITCAPDQEVLHAQTRVTQIRKEMFDLDPETILRETSSDNVFLWLIKKGKASTPGKNDSRDLIQSIEISEVETAIALQKVGGHATYCRAPPKVEQNLVSSLCRSTGLGCGQYDPSGESITSLARGEVETFISTPGHVTNWHFDFQENFTIQLSGIKKWTLQQGTISDPIRGCTPHYAAPEAVESQLKAAHLMNRKFRFGHPTTGVNAMGKMESILLRPGDVFYFPAGMWHKVETIEPGVSINVSLMATNYATVVSQAIQHILHTLPHWRQPILQNEIHNVDVDLGRLLQKLPSELQKVLYAPQCILPPVLQNPPKFQSSDDLEAGNEEADAVHDEATDEDEHDDEGEMEEEEDVQETLEALAPNIEEEEEEGEEHDEVMDPLEFDDYPKNWRPEILLTTSPITLQRNRLAVLHRMEEISSFYRNRKCPTTNEAEEESSSFSNVFVLNVNYAGNELHQSGIRVVFCDSSKGGVVAKFFSQLEETDTPKIEWTPSAVDLPFVKFLLYHGYLILQTVV